MRRWLFVSLSLMLVACGNMPPPDAAVPAANMEPTPSVAPAEPEPTTTMSDNAMRVDAESYAVSYGVSVDEALQRLRLQNPIGTLNVQLERNEAATFGGLWVEHTPRYRVIVFMTEAGMGRVEQYIKDGPLVSLVEVRPARFTFETLLSTQTETQRIIEQLNIRTSAQTDVMNNRVTVEVFDQAAVEAALRDANLHLPDAATLVEVARAQPGAAPTVDPTFGYVGFFRQLPADGPRSYPAALLEGELRLVDNCLRIVTEPDAPSYVPIWMPDANLQNIAGTLTVVDGAGKVIGSVGARIALGGGEVPADHWDALSDLPPRPTCPGPYWLASP